jgi:hypothetical protein
MKRKYVNTHIIIRPPCMNDPSVLSVDHIDGLLYALQFSGIIRNCQLFTKSVRWKEKLNTEIMNWDLICKNREQCIN